MKQISLIPLSGLPEIRPGDDLAQAIATSAGPGGLEDADVVVVAQKVVSKSEGRVVAGQDRSSAVLHESVRVLRRRDEMTISETRHGFVCANAGVDASNVPPGSVALLPLDPDLSARRLRARLARVAGADVAVVISDTFGRPWRIGQVNVAIGVAGIDPFVDHRGSLDSFDQELVATQICIADELASAAELVMGKSDGIPAAIVRGARLGWGEGSARAIVRPPSEDLFR